MKLRRLRIVGFKSFVDPTDVPIEPGLTGIVGPNGCGKSNLVEALRWAMGESSHKSLRAAGMDDVIFAGSQARPARNFAEVTLGLDNSSRTAPAAFNDADSLDISRRIEREQGSTYRINGREVRARDVQILFADAATGARSPAMVRQGQIGEIISAKPQARRRILEDAAGIAGLHARRHEAELRLKAAEANLTRVEDLVGQIDTRLEQLRKQARQAARYRTVAAEIRKAEALLLLIAIREAEAAALQAQRDLDAATREVAQAQHVQTQAATAQAVAAHAAPKLREEAAAAAAAVHRLTSAREALDLEERRARARAAELERRSHELRNDLERERAHAADAGLNLDRLSAERTELETASAQPSLAEVPLVARLEAARERLDATERRRAGAQKALSDAHARRAAADRQLRDHLDQIERLQRELQRTEREIASFGDRDRFAAELERVRTEFDRAAASAAEAEERIAPMRARLARARETEAATRTAFSEAERAAQRLETEARTLRKLLTSGTRDLWPSVLDALTVERGLETALGAALGDDLEASVEPSAPIHWRQTDATGDCALPEGATPLSELVSGPPALRRRLAQIGLVDRAGGAALGLALRPGQMLVSREGDLWRWDGYVAAAEAPTAAARRLAEKNRLADVEGAFEAASRVVEDHRRRAEAARKGVADASVEEAAAIDTARLERRALETVRARLQEAEQRVAEFARRVATLEGSHQRLSAEIADAAARATTARADIAALPGTDSLERELALASDEAARCRADEGEARAGLDALRREASARQRRLDAIAAEMAAWEQRRSRAQAQIESFDSRSAGITGELASLEAAPAAFAEQRRALTHEIEAAQARARARSDALSVGEAALVEADRAARAALEALSATRERRARSEERVSAAGARLGLLVESIAENFETDAAGLAALAGMAGGLELPAGESVERALNRLKEERERIGSVNLQADEELKALGDEKERLEADRNDLAEAIRRLRQAIQNLNRQGRERLSEAFSVVNGHFQALFTELFGGGTAELQFVESDDPLMAGLEIVARPPGKKPQTLSLLSGGEQTLTAIALIFAVFLTNPAPICVLDEVDAPLDDSNVERFCDLVHHICERTGTRFLVITHNPITMARMDRLFGVTMPERGASQIVSVDLETAERFRDAV